MRYIFGMCVGLIFTSVAISPVLADALKFSASFSVNSAGNTNVDIQNVSNVPVTVYSVIINRKENDAMCHLKPFLDMDGVPFFVRGDITEEELELFRYIPQNSVKLQFGDEAGIAVFRGCGSILELKLVTDLGPYLFTSK